MSQIALFLFTSTYKMLHLLYKVKNAWVSVSPTNVKLTYGIFAANFCSVLLPSSLNRPTPTKWGEGGAITSPIVT